MKWSYNYVLNSVLPEDTPVFQNPFMKIDILGQKENLNKLKIKFIKTEPKRDF